VSEHEFGQREAEIVARLDAADAHRPGRGQRGAR
jgi:hypothetical protein